MEQYGVLFNFRESFAVEPTEHIQKPINTAFILCGLRDLHQFYTNFIHNFKADLDRFYTSLHQKN